MRFLNEIADLADEQLLRRFLAERVRDPFEDR